jgi:alanyl-tRNA synthetase
LLKVVGEGAVAAGVRRIEALTGAGALAHLEAQDRLVQSTAAAIRVQPSELLQRVAQLVEDRRRLEREVADLRRELALGGSGSAPDIRDVGGVKLASRIVDLPAKDLKPLVDELKKQIGEGVVVAIATSEGKASVVVGVTEGLTGRFSAVDLVRVASEVLGGSGGGGRRDMAQAGGSDPTRAADAVAAVEAAIARP